MIVMWLRLMSRDLTIQSQIKSSMWEIKWNIDVHLTTDRTAVLMSYNLIFLDYANSFDGTSLECKLDDLSFYGHDSGSDNPEENWPKMLSWHQCIAVIYCCGAGYRLRARPLGGAVGSTLPNTRNLDRTFRKTPRVRVPYRTVNRQ